MHRISYEVNANKMLKRRHVREQPAVFSMAKNKGLGLSG